MVRVGGHSQRAAHEHWRAIADKAGDRGIGQRLKTRFLEGGIHAVAQVLRRVDQRAVEIEDEQLQLLHGNGAKNPDHVSSVLGVSSAMGPGTFI